MAAPVDIAPQIAFVTATRYVQVASMTLLIYDHLLTAPQEINFVWRGLGLRSWPRFIFLAARYVPLSVLISNAFGHSWFFYHGWSGVILFAGVQVVSQLRLWAIYRSKRVIFAMTMLAVLALAGMGVVAGLGYRNIQVTSVHAFGHLHICGPSPLPKFVYIFWLPPLVVETISVMLVIYKAVHHFQLGAPKSWTGSRFMNSIVRYSVFYFVVALCVYVANFYVWLRQPIFAFELFIPLTFALPSVAGNRMLLSLRSIFYEENAMLPGPQNDSIGLKVVNADRGLIIETHKPLVEFDSFFGQTNASMD